MIWVHGLRYLQLMYPDHEKRKIRGCLPPGSG
jgi:hypothetical protein